ncbi:FAD-dependent oxidoreductase [Pseudonocardia kujensis]|uniref:flavin monoamine oxidase family protein n=1 Tax=Pseudonocardia kujensis TaxID=1128675 RepID=UPI001E367F02|nr:NAD(P)/FAD-dependent oxidoreductase [Pseudonocardia kujensis]MCE0763283.1 FAD-dependent oxidoreductase [Pseudonocardia kujensis]
MSDKYDVIVVGAGFAGATAARECAVRGLRTLVLEGRDRVGGRTWTSQMSDGKLVDIGGTYVHWRQPHVWAEISRYGLADDLIPGAEAPDQCLAPSASGMAWVDAEEYNKREAALLNQLFQNSQSYFPQPFKPLLRRADVEKLDRTSVREWMDQFDLSEEDHALVTQALTYETMRPAERSSILTWMRWWSVSGGDANSVYEAILGFKLAGGTASLLNAMLADGEAEVHLSEAVTRVDSTDQGVRVSTVHGRTYSSSAVVIATPSGVWPHIDFSPALAPERIQAAREGMQGGTGAAKILIRIKGEPRNINVLNRPGRPLDAVWTDSRQSDDEQTVVAIATSGMKDPGDPVEVAEALRELLPHVEVVDIAAGVYRLDDEFSRGAWMYYGLGQLTRFEPHRRFIELEGRIAFATADIATGWVGYIDGAIETGLRAARAVQQIVLSDA